MGEDIPNIDCPTASPLSLKAQIAEIRLKSAGDDRIAH